MKNQAELESPIVSIFLGQLSDCEMLELKPHPEDEGEALELILDSLDKFLETEAENFDKFDKLGAQSPDFIERLKELGLFGLIIHEDYGGSSLSARSYSRVLQQISLYDGATAITVGAHSSIGMKALLLFGSKNQKERYLPKLATGQLIAAFCLTEPQAGSDAASLKTKATKQNDGSWLLNGEKIWITNGPIAQFFTVFARTGEEGAKGISCFMVERDQEGVTIGKNESKMGIKGSLTSSVTFSDVILKPDALIGSEGQGFKIAVAVLNNGRSGLGGGCVGAMKRCLKLAARQASERKQFGSTLSSFGLIQEKLTRMMALCYISESLVQLVGQQIDSDSADYSIEAAASKVFTTEALWESSYEALQIAGGSGFMTEYPYEKITRDSRINMIFEGTNEILRLFIGLRSFEELGKYLKEVETSLGDFFSNPQGGLQTISQYVVRRVSFYTPTYGNSLINLAQQLQDEAKELVIITRQIGKIAEESIRTHRSKIKDQQLLVAKLANAAINVYAGLAVISRCNLKGSDKNQILVAKASLNLIIERAKSNLASLDYVDTGINSKITELLIDKCGYPFDITKN